MWEPSPLQPPSSWARLPKLGIPCSHRRQPLPHGLWPALALMLLGCGMVIGSKAAAAAGPRAARPRSAGGQPGTAAWMVGASAGSAPQRGGLFAARGEEAWLCTAAFGGTPLARLCAPSPGDLSATASGNKSQAIPVATARGPAEAAPRPDRTVQPGQGRTGTTAAALRKKRRAPPPPAPPPAGPSGLGLRDACGILLSLLGACCLAGFMLLVQVGPVVWLWPVVWRTPGRPTCLPRPAPRACLLPCWPSYSGGVSDRPLEHAHS